MKWADVETRFFDNLRARMRDKGLSSRALSLKMGWNEFYISTLLKGGSRLRVDTLLTLAEALEVDPMALLWGEERDGGNAVPHLPAYANHQATALLKQALELLGAPVMNPAQPRFEEVLSWWRDTGGQLVNCDHIIEHCDLHQVPDGATPRTMVRRLGSSSLATKIIGSPSIDRLHEEMDKAIPEDSRRVTEAYLAAQNSGPMLPCESLRGKLTSEAPPHSRLRPTAPAGCGREWGTSGS